MCAGRKAFTLPELLVAFGLLAFLTLAFLQFLLPTLNAMARATAQSELQQQALLAFERIERELRTSASTAVGVLSQSTVGAGQAPGLYLTPLQDVDGQGQANWEPKLLAVWWNPSSQRLLIKSWPPKDPPAFAQPPSVTRPAALSKLEFIDLTSGSNGSERFLAAGVSRFDVTHGGTGMALVPPLELHIELERQEGHHFERFKLNRVVSLRVL